MARPARLRSSLWGHRDFLLLGGGQSVSMLGSQVTNWALPFATIFTLDATHAQIGLPAAALGVLAATRLGVLYRVRPVVVRAGIGTLFALLVTLFSPIRMLRRDPGAVDEASFINESGFECFL